MSNGPNPTSEDTFSGPAFECALEIVETLHRHGFLAYFAGGCVRDSLLRIPASDFDVATSATPREVQNIFGADKTWLVGAAFGVVCMPVRRGKYRGQIEIATFRSDGHYSDGRHPDQVTFTTPERDAQRRDFTINGLFFDPIQKRILDFVGGVDDLKAGRLRAIGVAYDRFQEDKLRLLRAIRFAARFHLQIEPETNAAIQACAPQLAVVSVERIAEEVRKVVATDWRCWAIQQFHVNGLLKAIAQPLSDAWTSHPTCMQASLYMLEGLPSDDFATCWTALLLPIHFQHAQPGWFSHFLPLPGSNWASISALSQDWKERWKLANEEASAIAYYLGFIHGLLSDHPVPWSKAQPWLADPRAGNGLLLLDAFLKHFLQNQPSELRAQWQRQLQEYQASLAWPPELLNPPPLIDGGDLKRLGLQPGPTFSQLLKKVREMQLDQKLLNREQALAWVARDQSKPN